MKTQLYYGLRLVPITSNVVFVNDTKRTDYTAVFNYDKFVIMGKFESVCVHGFWIANAMCMN